MVRPVGKRQQKCDYYAVSGARATGGGARCAAEQFVGPHGMLLAAESRRVSGGPGGSGQKWQEWCALFTGTGTTGGRLQCELHGYQFFRGVHFSIHGCDGSAIQSG